MAPIYAMLYAGGLVLIWLSVKVSQWFIVLLLLLVAVCGFTLTERFRCPKYKKPALINPIRILGTEMWIYTMLPPKKCSNCGTDLI